MSEQEIIKEFGKMWGEEKNNYALVKRNDHFFGYTIMNTVYNSKSIIEENDTAKYVIKKMIENGVPVVDNFEQVRNPNRPDPIFYSAELEAQYRKLQEQKKNQEIKKGKKSN